MSEGIIRHDFVDAINILANSSKDAYAVIKGWLDVCNTSSAAEISITVTGPNGPETLTVPNLAKAMAAVTGAGAEKTGTSFTADDPVGARGYKAVLAPKMLTVSAYGKDASYRGSRNSYYDLETPIAPSSTFQFFDIPRHLMLPAASALDGTGTHTVNIGPVPKPGSLPQPHSDTPCVCCEMDVSNGLPSPATVVIQRIGTAVPLLTLQLAPAEHVDVFIFGWAGYDTINAVRK